MNPPRFGVALRWIVAASLGAGGIYLLARVMTHESDWIIIFAKSLYGLAALMSGVLLAAPELVRWAVTPIHRVIDQILLPSETEVPPVDFKLARYYAHSLRYEEACEEYFEIIRYHPEQTAAYLEGIRAASLAGDAGTAKKFYKAARRIMRTRDERRLLKGIYTARHRLETVSG